MRAGDSLPRMNAHQDCSEEQREVRVRGKQRVRFLRGGMKPVSHSHWVHLDVELVKKVTEKAMLVVVGGEEYWLPLSQVSEGEKYEEGDADLTVSVTEWIAKQKGL